MSRKKVTPFVESKEEKLIREAINDLLYSNKPISKDTISQEILSKNPSLSSVNVEIDVLSAVGKEDYINISHNIKIKYSVPKVVNYSIGVSSFRVFDEDSVKV